MAGKFYGSKAWCALCERDDRPMHVKLTDKTGICQACFAALRYKDPEFQRQHRKSMLDSFAKHREKRLAAMRRYSAKKKV